MQVLRFASIPRLPPHAVRQALWLAAVLAMPVGAQNLPQPRGSQQQPLGQRMGDSGDEFANGDYAEQLERMRALNRERQKTMISDTNKLLKLATELDMEVKSDDADSLTPSQMRTLASIEKLAHDVKDKMTYSVSVPSATPPQTQSPFRLR
jgi:hypothetical protein